MKKRVLWQRRLFGWTDEPFRWLKDHDKLRLKALPEDRAERERARELEVATGDR